MRGEWQGAMAAALMLMLSYSCVVHVYSLVGAAKLLGCKRNEGILIKVILALVLGEFSSCRLGSGVAVSARSTFAVRGAGGVRERDI